MSFFIFLVKHGIGKFVKVVQEYFGPSVIINIGKYALTFFLMIW